MAKIFLASLISILLSAGAPRAAAARHPQPAADSSAAAPAPKAPATWPRTFEKGGNTLVMYAPQVDSWTDHSIIRFRAAIALTPEGSAQQHYGVVAVKGDTIVDHEARTVLVTNLDVATRFPGAPDATAGNLKALVNDCLPNLSYLDVSLDHVLAHMHADSTVRTAAVNLEPPRIFYSDTPAILVSYMGEPQFKPVKDTSLMFAVNTNWPVLMDTQNSQYYLLDNDSWLTSPDPLKGPWTPAGVLPSELSKLPDSGNWEDVRKNIPGKPIKVVPRVLTSNEPAELIVTQGAPDYTPIIGTRLMYVSNPEMPLFLDLIDNNYYFLVAGRWFRSPDPNGPWSAASANLPPEFARIPLDSPMSFVLASVPGTQEAEDAVLLAQVPHKATINIQNAKCTVAYDGAPKFVAIQGTPMTYATNTAYQVVYASGQYYCCQQGVWFISPAATGPWGVCASVPAVVYTIPPASPLYNVTYVRVYSSTPSTVVVGYTSGYSGEYVAATGALMFGAGMLTGALLASNNNCWYGCSPCFYSYGCAAHYSYGYGCYCRAGGAYYGPHGGAGWGAGYNPATGNWSRGGYAYGSHGAAWGSQAYNPWTNTYSAHAGATNGYHSWGASTVSHGDEWASAAHQSGIRGSTGWAENSSGQWAQGAHSNLTDSSVARGSGGNVFASHDGNVYKAGGDGGWQKYQGSGNWSDSSWNRPTTASNSISNAATEDSWKNGMQSRAQSSSTNSWRSDSGSDQWKSSWENRSSSQGSWGQHDVESGLNRDSWSRDRGESNSASSWGSRSSGSRFGGGGWGGGGGRSWGGGGRSFGGGFGRFRR